MPAIVGFPLLGGRYLLILTNIIELCSGIQLCFLKAAWSFGSFFWDLLGQVWSKILCHTNGVRLLNILPSAPWKRFARLLVRNRHYSQSCVSTLTLSVDPSLALDSFSTAITNQYSAKYSRGYSANLCIAISSLDKILDIKWWSCKLCELCFSLAGFSPISSTRMFCHNSSVFLLPELQPEDSRCKLSNLKTHHIRFVSLKSHCLTSSVLKTTDTHTLSGFLVSSGSRVNTVPLSTLPSVKHLFVSYIIESGLGIVFFSLCSFFLIPHMSKWKS